METALISSITAIIVSIITFVRFLQLEARQRKNLALTQKRNITEKLIGLRLEHYPKAFELTDLIQKSHGNTLDSTVIENANLELNLWRSGVVRMIVSEETNFHFYELRGALSKNPGDGKHFTESQVEKIWKHRANFRQSLRNDIGLLHSEDENRL